MIGKEFLAVYCKATNVMIIVHRHLPGVIQVTTLVELMEDGTTVLLDVMTRIVTHNRIGIQVWL